MEQLWIHLLNEAKAVVKIDLLYTWATYKEKEKEKKARPLFTQETNIEENKPQERKKRPFWNPHSGRRLKANFSRHIDWLSNHPPVEPVFSPPSHDAERKGLQPPNDWVTGTSVFRVMIFMGDALMWVAFVWILKRWHNLFFLWVVQRWDMFCFRGGLWTSHKFACCCILGFVPLVCLASWLPLVSTYR